MQRNANEIVKKSGQEQEQAGMLLKSPMYHKIYRGAAVFSTLAAISANGLYVRYFSFASVLMRAVYLFFTCLHPLAVILANCYISSILSDIKKDM
jgi:hypothetical protein